MDMRIPGKLGWKPFTKQGFVRKRSQVHSY